MRTPGATELFELACIIVAGDNLEQIVEPFVSYNP